MAGKLSGFMESILLLIKYVINSNCGRALRDYLGFWRPKGSPQATSIGPVAKAYLGNWMPMAVATLAGDACCNLSMVVGSPKPHNRQ